MNYLELSFTFPEKGDFADIVDARFNEIEFEIIREKSEKVKLEVYFS